ncbi:senescence-associated protein 20 [Artemisia annua]|uniref:Senescence-associated protein 20 n=1 Tax=Artemisia annua TaxID=35608 RepID=A0A2U1LUS2_ARTAN|nr:senescence-associated protein 20 [Artemisia annua]
MEGVNKNIICDFYKALSARDTNTVHRLLAQDIDWWFHGPPAHKYNLMQVLTGTRDFEDNDSYEPLIVVSIGSMVVAEGYHIHERRKTYWVHVWTVENEKIITQVREYLDTSVTVTRITKSSNVLEASPRSPESKKMWESKLGDSVSVPRLLLVL